MENMKLSTYSTIIPNEVFGRKVDPIVLPSRKEVPATQVAKLTRFKVPVYEDVLNFIKRSANDVSVHQPLQLILTLLPDTEIKKIREGDELSLKHLKNHYPYDLEEGRTYIEVLNGIVPTEILERAGIATLMGLFHGENGEDDIYHSIIKKLGKDEWTLRIRLTEEGLFPEVSELEYLLERGVRDSKPLYIEGASKDYSDIANHARLLYNASSLVGYIKDSSKHFLNQRACLTVKGAAACIVTNDVMKSELISNIIQGHKEPYGGGASNN